MTIIEQPTYSALVGSPALFYVEETAPLVKSIQCEVFLWRGAIADKPATPSYTLKKSVVYEEGEARAMFDVAQFAKDEIEQQNALDLANAVFKKAVKETIWLSCEFTGIGNSSPATVASNNIICVNGYATFYEGSNYEVPTVLTSVTNIIMPSDGMHVLGLANHYGTDWETIKITYDTGLSDVFTNVIIDKSESENNLLYFDLSPSLYVGSYNSAYKVELLNDDDEVLETLYFKVVDKCKYEPFTVAYLNKWGAWDWIPFTLKSETSTTAETSEYMSNISSTNYGKLAADASVPQYKRYNTNYNSQIKLNTEYLKEEIHLGINQLLVTERAIIVEKGWSVNPITSNFVTKQGVNEKLIQYSLDFKYAFEGINTIR